MERKKGIPETEDWCCLAGQEKVLQIVLMEEDNF